MTYLLTAVIFLAIGFTLGMVAKPAEPNPLKESRNETAAS